LLRSGGHDEIGSVAVAVVISGRAKIEVPHGNLAFEPIAFFPCDT
jgi:hypothetical protein